jgi:hypothetical protein
MEQIGKWRRILSLSLSLKKKKKKKKSSLLRRPTVHGQEQDVETKRAG